MKVGELISKIDNFAPFFLQESYDNSGLQFGDLEEEVKKVVLSLELTEVSVNFAIKNNANVVLSHHPILFFSVKNIVKQDMPTLYKAIKNGINVVAAHTNFDIAENGLNDFVGNMLEIEKEGPIQYSHEKIYKFAVYVPKQHADEVRKAVFEAGAGKIGKYGDTSFNVSGIGTFKPMEGTHPFIGAVGETSTVDEIKIETVVPERFLNRVIFAMKQSHPYEEPAYDIFELKSVSSNSGIGMVGKLGKKFSLPEFAQFVKSRLNARYVRFIGDKNVGIERVAFCSGSGFSLINSVRSKNVDLFISGDITYHNAIRAKEIGVNILDVEHFDTEKFFVPAMKKSLLTVGANVELIEFNDEKSPFDLL